MNVMNAHNALKSALPEPLPDDQTLTGDTRIQSKTIQDWRTRIVQFETAVLELKNLTNLTPDMLNPLVTAIPPDQTALMTFLKSLDGAEGGQELLGRFISARLSLFDVVMRLHSSNATTA